MMEVRRVTQEDHKTINAWESMRGVALTPKEFFPDIGLIIDGIGAGFIYQTDSKLCFIENYISCPGLSREEKNKAFDLITENLILIAKEFGFLAILAMTKHSSIKERCIRFGFEYKNQYDLYVKEV